MATPINLSPPAPQAYQPPPSRTSGALVLNINAPLSNYAGDGPMPAPQSPTQGANAGGNMFGPQSDSFQKTSGSGSASAPFSPNPFASPEQNLENYYKEAVKKRQEAENFRNDYLNYANQLSGQAYQNKMSPFGLSNNTQSPFPPPVSPAMQQEQFQQQLMQLQQAQQLEQMKQQMQQQSQQLMQMQQKVQQEQEAAQQAAQQAQMKQQEQLQQMQQMALQQQNATPPMPQYNPADPMAMAQQQQAGAGAPPPYNPYDPMAMAQQQQAGAGAPPPYNPYDPAAMAQQQAGAGAPPPYNPYDPAAMAQQQMMAQQPTDPAAMAQQQMAQQPQGLGAASVADLNNMLLQPQTPKDKLDAINEIAMRQQGDRQTYELLKQEATNSTPGLQPDDANLIRQAALFALGNLNRVQNAQVPTGQLPGMDAINRIINNKSENPAVKAAAVTALGYIDRPQDRIVQNMLKKASRDKNPDVKQAVTQVQSGMMSAAAQQQQAAAAPPQYNPADPMQGQYDPAVLQQLLQQQAPSPQYSPMQQATPQGYPIDPKLQQQGGMPMMQPGMAQMF